MDQSDSPTRDGAPRALFRIPRRSVVDDVRAQLIRLIESGRVKVNERLPSENELARSFGVSRPVIREALGSLHALGLTTAQTGKGTFVASSRVRTPLLQGRYSPTHLNEARRHLEVPCARLAALRRTGDDLARLAAILAQVDECEDPARRNKADAEFHIAIAQATGNPLFVKLVEDLRTMLEEQSLAVSVVPGRRRRASVEHREIYAAIERGDGAAAAAGMGVHLDGVDASVAALGLAQAADEDGALGAPARAGGRC